MAAARPRRDLARRASTAAGTHEESGPRRSVSTHLGRLFQKRGGAARRAYGMERRVRIRHADLFRFFRLYGYGDRHGGASGLSFSCQLSPSLPGGEPDRFLAPLAYLAIHL